MRKDAQRMLKDHDNCNQCQQEGGKLIYQLVWRVHNKFCLPPRDVAHCCTDIRTGAGSYGQGLWQVSLGERQLLLRSTLTGSLTFIGSVIAMLTKTCQPGTNAGVKGSSHQQAVV